MKDYMKIYEAAIYMNCNVSIILEMIEDQLLTLYELVYGEYVKYIKLTYIEPIIVPVYVSRYELEEFKELIEKENVKYKW